MVDGAGDVPRRRLTQARNDTGSHRRDGEAGEDEAYLAGFDVFVTDPAGAVTVEYDGAAGVGHEGGGGDVVALPFAVSAGCSRCCAVHDCGYRLPPWAGSVIV